MRAFRTARAAAAASLGALCAVGMSSSTLASDQSVSSPIPSVYLSGRQTLCWDELSSIGGKRGKTS